MASECKRRNVFNILGGRCYYCGCKLSFDNFHMDHFFSKAKGGKDKDNLVPACPECNLYKSNLGIEAFREKLADELLNTFHGRLVEKYYGAKPKKIKFFYEEGN